MSHGYSFLLVGAALTAALIYWLGFCRRSDPGLAGAWTKAVSTALLALILWIAVAQGLGLWTVALGLSFGALGDWFLARRGDASFLAGMAAFALGHLAYAGGLFARSAELGFDGQSTLETLVLLLLLGLLISTEVWLAPRTGQLKWPVRGYVAVIGAMGIVLVFLPDRHGADTLRLGGALFILSDLLLALRLFVVTEKTLQDRLSLTLWPAYWTGQALIGLGATMYWDLKG